MIPCGYRKTSGKQEVSEGSGSVLDPILYRILYRVNRLAFMRGTMPLRWEAAIRFGAALARFRDARAKS